MKIKSLITTAFILIVYLLNTTKGLGVIQPKADISLSVINYNSPTLISFKFQLTTKLLNKYYMLVYFPNQWKEVTARNCVYSKGALVPSTYAKSCTSSGRTVQIQFNEDLLVNQEYNLIVELKETVPTVLKSQMSGIFRLETRSSLITTTSSNIFDKNPVFGMVPITLPGKTFDVVVKSFGATSTKNIAEQENTLTTMVSISQTTRTVARIKVIVSYPWTFVDVKGIKTSKMTVSDESAFPAESLIPPTISKIDQKSENEFDIVFTTALKQGQIFILTIPKIKNPGYKETGGLYMYLMETNSNSYIAGFQQPTFFSVKQYIIPITLSHPSGIPMNEPPMNYYKGKHQGFKLSFSPPQALPVNSIIQVKLNDNDNYPIKGSLFVQVKTSSTVLTDVTERPTFLAKYRFNSVDEILITINNKPIAAGNLVNLIFRVILTTTEDLIKPTLNIWTDPNAFGVEDPLYYGSASFDVYSPSDALVTEVFQDTQDTTFLFNVMNQVDTTGTAVKLTLKLSTKQNDAAQKSTLDIYLPKSVVAHSSFSATDCKSIIGGGSLTPSTGCTIVTGATYTKISMPSAAGQNLFGNGGTSTPIVTIDNLKILDDSVSNFQDNMHDMFIRLTSCNLNTVTRLCDDGTGGGTLDLVRNIVIQSWNGKFPNCLVGLSNVLAPNTNGRSSNIDTKETETKITKRPSFVNIGSKTATDPAITLATNEKLIITIFSADTFQRIVQSKQLIGTATAPLTGVVNYPCASNLKKYECRFTEGERLTTQKVETVAGIATSLDYFFDYDRVDVIFELDATLTDGWHVIVPTLLIIDNQKFFTLIGTYNTVTEEILYKGSIGQQIFTAQTSSFPLDNKPTIIQIATPQQEAQPYWFRCDFVQNQPSGKKIDLSLQLASESNFVGNDNANNDGFSSAVVLMTDWELWINKISYIDSDANTNNNGVNQPLATYFTDIYGGVKYFTYIPMISPSNLNAGQATILIKQVFLPYSYDINTYYMYLISRNGQGTNFFEEENLGQGWLQVNQITSSTFKCDQQNVNLYNIKCELQFSPNNMIEQNGIITVKIADGYVSTKKCTLSYAVPNALNPLINKYSCTTSNDTLTVVLDHSYRLPALTKYKLEFSGLDTNRMIKASDYYPDITLQIKDHANVFVIEQEIIQTFKMSQVDVSKPIKFTSVVFSEKNAKTVTTLVLQFDLPRDLFSNEEILFRLGIDLEASNLGNERMLLTIYDSANQAMDLNLVWMDNILSIKWDDPLVQKFTQGSYKIQINGLTTPTSLKNGVPSIFYRRMSDQAIVLKSDDASVNVENFKEFPLDQFFISGTQYFTEGLLGSISFTIKTRQSHINPQSKIFFFFPTIFSPSLTNKAELLTCKIESVSIPCRTDLLNPYRLELYTSPITINTGKKFTVTVYGLSMPDYSTVTDKTALNGFVGIKTLKDTCQCYEDFYTEQGEFTLPIIKAMNAEHQFVSLFDLQVSDTTLRASVTYTLDLDFKKRNIVPYKSKLFVSFPAAYTLLQFFTDPLATMIQSYNPTTKEKVTLDTGKCVIEGQTLIYTINAEEGVVLEDNERMLLIISDVPNPQTSINLNPNELQIKIFSQTNDDLLFISNSQVNFAEPIWFPALKNTFIINDYNPIYVTAGTYTDFMQIKYSEGARFLSDVQLSLSSNVFKVIPNKVDFTRGDTGGKFKIGADKDLFLKGFPIFITKKEALGKSEFQNYDNLKGFVTYDPVVIDIPDVIKVPFGGSSLISQIILNNRPFNGIELTMLIDFNSFGEDLMIDSQFSSPSIAFDYNHYLGNIQVSCLGLDRTFKEYQQLSPNITVSIHGTNDVSYKLSTSTIKLEIVEQANLDPIVQIQVTTVKKVEAEITIETNQEGILFYQFYNAGTKNMTLDEIKDKVKNNGYVEKNEGDLGQMAKTENAPMTKISLQFSQSVTLDTMNTLLCFLSDLVITSRFYIFTSDGYYCSVSVEPDVIQSKYTGQSLSTFQYATNLYFQANPEYAEDPALKLLEKYIPVLNASSTVPVLVSPTPEFFTLAKANDLNMFKNVTRMFSFQEKLAKEGSAPLVVPTVTNIKYTVSIEQVVETSIVTDDLKAATNASSVTDETQSSNRVKFSLNNIELSGDGKLYYIMEKTQFYYQDPEDPTYWSPKLIRNSKLPTPQQIYDCQNYQNKTTTICGKIVITNGQNGTIQIPNLQDFSIYQLYYVTANEYPLSNVLAKTGLSMQIDIFSLTGLQLQFQVITLLIIGFVLTM